MLCCPCLSAGQAAAGSLNTCIMAGKGSCLLEENTRIFVKHAVITCLEVCWGLCSTARAVFCGSRILSSEGFAGQVHSCCSLQLSMFFSSLQSSLHCAVGSGAVCHLLHLMQDSYPLSAAPTCCTGFPVVLQAVIR